jgi:hypothetical protein
VRAAAAGAVTAVAAVAAAAVVVLTPAGKHAQTSALRAAKVQEGAPVLVVVAANPTLAAKDTVPRLKMTAASVADGPVHGLFNTPVVPA